MNFIYRFAIVWMLGVSAMAEVPSGTYPIGELEKAKAEALERKKSLAFLVSDPESKYQKSQDATALAIKELRGYAVVVFLISKQDEEIVMPPPVVTVLRGSTVGIYDPKIILLSPDLVQTFDAVGSEKIVGNVARETHRELKKSARAKLQAWKAGGKPVEELIWIKTDGKHYRGRYVEVKGGRLQVESEKYGKGSVALDELSPASRAFAEQLAGTGEISEQEAPSGEEIEPWTSTDGKVVSARFVSLKDGELTVETAAGKSYSFPLQRLDQTSQTRAKELAQGKD